jgi:protein-S-isoprenylcysteine O-methyltransferase Ste14
VNAPALLLVLLNFVALAVITRRFFRRTDERHGRAWWLTAVPFFLAPALLVVADAVPITALTPDRWNRGLGLGAIVLGATSLALMFWTLGTHRIPIALFHQENDAPQRLVTDGVYGRIRHPFYASYLVLFLAVLVLWPHWLSLAMFAYVATNLNRTAAQEEQRLSASEFGPEYQQYMIRTGRFFPALGARAQRPVPVRSEA